jgi:hypothetical protein
VKSLYNENYKLAVFWKAVVARQLLQIEKENRIFFSFYLWLIFIVAKHVAYRLLLFLQLMYRCLKTQSKEQCWRYYHTRLQIILQSNNNKNSMVLAQKQT